MSIKEVTDPDKEDSMFIIYILSAAVFMFCVIVAVVAFVVGRQRGRRTTNPRQDVRDVSEIHDYNELVDIVRGYSNPYSGTADNQYTASNSNDNTSYLTPCTFTRLDSSNEYAYID
ncbi:uncharacterized protein LOC132753390 [Ruditapes philippinarum]|uniref:uncharacterized protein LOC132753390 n=1 Tax=Ruditapes philippinarum TaxID=129788 RepID=UPI00295B8074|nr:uncharacterized protein LOC132753390 [Ruditapes philippinarum]